VEVGSDSGSEVDMYSCLAQPKTDEGLVYQEHIWPSTSAMMILISNLLAEYQLYETILRATSGAHDCNQCGQQQLQQSLRNQRAIKQLAGGELAEDYKSVKKVVQ